MKRSTVVWAVVGVVSVAMTVTAADLDIRVVAAGTGIGNIEAAPGDTVTYQVIGELSDGTTGGLASAVFDLECSGAVLQAVNLPLTGPMSRFAPPLGTALNPMGFGGTPATVGLVQVGGSQNVANHGRWDCTTDRDCPDGAPCSAGLCAPLPGMATGDVLTGVADPGFPEVLVSGSFQVPGGVDTVTLQAAGIRASALVAGADGVPVWFTESVGEGNSQPLVVTVTQAPAPAIPAASPTALGLFAALLGGLGWLVVRRVLSA